MKPIPKKWRVVIWCGAFLLMVVVFRGFLFRQVRAYYIGTVELRAEETGANLPEADEVEVLSLGREAPFVDNILGYSVHKRATLRGEPAAKVVELWRRQSRGRHFSGMCHDPGYGLRFRQRGKLLFETTVCWDCNNYSLPAGIFGQEYYGFDAGTEYARQLIELLQTHAPLPKKPEAKPLTR